MSFPRHLLWTIFLCTAAVISARENEEILCCDFSKSPCGWKVPTYWGGRMKWTAGKGIELLPTVKRRQLWARILRSVDIPGKPGGRIFNLTIKTSGKGKGRLGILTYTRINGHSSEPTYCWSPLQNLSDTPASRTYRLDLRSQKNCHRIALCTELQGDGNMTIYEARLTETEAACLPVPLILSSFAPQWQPQNTLLDNRFETEKDCRKWHTTSYWAGKLTPGTENFMQLTSTVRRGRIWGRSFCYFPHPALTGKLLKYSVILRGKGTAKLGAIVYQRNKKGEKIYPYIWSRPFSLASQWQQVDYLMDFTRISPFALGLCLDLDGEGNLDFTHISITPMENPQIKINPRHQCMMFSSPKNIPAVYFDNLPAHQQVSVFFPELGCEGNQTAVTADSSGVLTVIPPPQCRSGKIIASTEGKVAETVLLPISSDKNRQYAELTNRINIPPNSTILFLGDSLLDFDRQFNTVAQLEFLLNQKKGNRIRVINHAVRGDTILRVERRLTGNHCYRYQEYNDLKEFSADLIFILLGHNDTQASAKNNFRIPAVPAVQQEAAYEHVLAILKKIYPEAKIILVSSTSSDFSYLQKLARQTLARGRKNFSCFGIPEHMENFNKVLQKLAEKHKLDYLDIYTGMKKLPDKNSLLRKGDGVHLNLKGQIYLMERLLEFLAEKY